MMLYWIFMFTASFAVISLLLLPAYTPARQRQRKSRASGSDRLDKPGRIL
jgi:hypothetical protein